MSHAKIIQGYSPEEIQEINNVLNLPFLDIFKIYGGEENDTSIEFLNDIKKEYDEFLEELEGKEGDSMEYIEGIIDTLNKFENYFK